MLIACPNCATTYDLSAEALGDGRNVRCARCATTWFATAPAATPALAPSAGFEPPPNWPAGVRYIAPDGAAPAPEAQPAGRDLAPAEAVTVAIDSDAAPLVPAEGAEAVVADADPSPPEDIETVAARQARLARAAARKPPRRRWIGAAIAGAAAAAVTLLALRVEVVRLAPQTARLYRAIGFPVNLRGVEIQEVAISGETHEGVPVLVIEGKVVSRSKQTVEVPRLRFAMRGNGGVELYAWTAQPPTRVLGAGETLPFRTRLASPPAEARDLVVRFLHRRDL